MKYINFIQYLFLLGGCATSLFSLVTCGMGMPFNLFISNEKLSLYLTILVIIISVIKLCILYQKTEGAFVGSIILSCSIIYFHIIDVFFSDFIMIKDIVIHFIPVSIISFLSLFMPWSEKVIKRSKKIYLTYVIPILLFFFLKTSFSYYKSLLIEIEICLIVIIHLSEFFIIKLKDKKKN